MKFNLKIVRIRMNKDKVDIPTYKINSLHLNSKTSLENMTKKVHFPGLEKKPLKT